MLLLLLLLRTAGDVSVDELKRVAAKGEGLTVRTAALGREVLVNSGDVAAGDLERVAGFVDLPLEVREVGIGTDDSGAEALAAALVDGGCDRCGGLGETLLGLAPGGEEGGAGGGGGGGRGEHVVGGRHGCFEVLLLVLGVDVVVVVDTGSSTTGVVVLVVLVLCALEAGCVGIKTWDAGFGWRKKTTIDQRGRRLLKDGRDARRPALIQNAVFFCWRSSLISMHVVWYYHFRVRGQRLSWGRKCV